MLYKYFNYYYHYTLMPPLVDDLHPYPHIRIDSKQILPAFLPGLGQRQVRLPGVLQERKHNGLSFSSDSTCACNSRVGGASTADFMFTEMSDSVCMDAKASDFVFMDTSNLISRSRIHGHIWHRKYRFTYLSHIYSVLLSSSISSL